MVSETKTELITSRTKLYEILKNMQNKMFLIRSMEMYKGMMNAGKVKSGNKYK